MKHAPVESGPYLRDAVPAEPLLRDSPQRAVATPGGHGSGDLNAQAAAGDGRRSAPSSTGSRSARRPGVAVVGAGPYGLALSAQLSHAGIEHSIFGADPMGSWRHNMPQGMMLKSLPPFSSIYAGKAGHRMPDFCRATNRPVVSRIDEVISADLFIQYGLWYQQQLVSHLRRENVRKVSEKSGTFLLELESGEQLPFAKVVLATGTPQFHKLPEVLQQVRDPRAASRISHTGQHHDLARFAGSTVVVVGAGQSALENAVIMAEHGANVHLLVRQSRPIPWGSTPYEKGLFGRLYKPETPLGPGWSFVAFTNLPDWVSVLPLRTRLHLVRTVLGPGGGWWLKDRFKRAGITARMRSEIAAIEPQGDKLLVHVKTGDGDRLRIEADHVMAGTGYQIDVDRMPVLDKYLRTRISRLPGTTAPALSRTYESSVPGLHFSGLAAAPTFGPLLRFVAGSGFTARVITRQLQRAAVG